MNINCCPFCQTLMVPEEVEERSVYSIDGETEDRYKVLQCVVCSKLYFAVFDENNSSEINPNELYPSNLAGQHIKIDDKIRELSPRFFTIYNQSEVARQNNLNELVGSGLRKALEFLIKDYAILNNPSQKEDIEKDTLSNVINNRIANADIKDLANRVNWLGSDHTHYLSVYPEYNVDDLSFCISVVMEEVRHDLNKRQIREIDKRSHKPKSKSRQ